MIVYKITNLINNKIYIGQTKKAIEKRFSAHLKEANSKSKRRCPHLYNAINKYGKENFKIEKIIEADCMQMLNYLEMYYIYIFDSTNKDIGYNILHGFCCNLPKSVTRKMTETKREKGAYLPENNPMYGKHHSEETKTKIREKAIGRKMSEETKRNMSIAQTGRKQSPESIQKMIKSKTGVKRGKRSYEWTQKLIQPHLKKVKQYDLEGVFIQEYASIKEASKINNIHNSCIANCCNNRRKIGGGFIWQFSSNINSDIDAINISKKIKSLRSTVKPVIQFTQNNEFVKEYESITIASKHTNINHGNIGMCCNGHRKTGGGFIWKFKNND